MRLVLTGLIVLSVAITSWAQDGPRAEPRVAEGNSVGLVDSYGQINEEDVKARLDFFAIELQRHSDAKAYIVSYGPCGTGSGTASQIVTLQKEYLVNARGIAPEQIEAIVGGRYRDPLDSLTQLWVVPQGASPPEIIDYANGGPLKGKVAVRDGWDGSPEEVGLGDAVLAGIADQLARQPNDVVYLAASNYRGSVIGTWRRVANRDAASLKERGVAEDRIKIIFAGTVKAKDKNDAAELAKIEFWIQPASAAPPVKEAKKESAPKEAVKLGTHTGYLVGDAKEERLMLQGVADLLVANPQLSVCLIVRSSLPEVTLETEEEPPSAAPLPADSLPEIEPLKLAERWKDELTKKLGIKANRLIVLPAVASESYDAGVEFWVVPPGVALPDPYAPAAEDDPQ
jgi:hypothetical protein